MLSVERPSFLIKIHSIFFIFLFLLLSGCDFFDVWINDNLNKGRFSGVLRCLESEDSPHIDSSHLRTYCGKKIEVSLPSTAIDGTAKVSKFNYGTQFSSTIENVSKDLFVTGVKIKLLIKGKDTGEVEIGSDFSTWIAPGDQADLLQKISTFDGSRKSVLEFFDQNPLSCNSDERPCWSWYVKEVRGVKMK